MPIQFQSSLDVFDFQSDERLYIPKHLDAVLTNACSTGAIALTLPPAVLGVKLGPFYVQEDQTLRIRPDDITAEAFIIDFTANSTTPDQVTPNALAIGKVLTSTTPGSYLVLRPITNASNWNTMERAGVWNVSSS